MGMRLYNTLTRKKEDFEPLEAGKVGMYTCGPTVYNFAHIGNFRAYVFEDLLRRHLKYRKYDVVQVMNLTDVEDKIIRACRESGSSLAALTGKYKDAFFEDLDTLGIERAEHYPAATNHIGEMVDLVKKLRDKGHTYESKGSIYFRLSSFADYGKLSHFDIDQLQSGASGRVDTDEYGVEDARDFALWKAYEEEDGEVFWETELGKGRPGWHIECSAMSTKYLGDTFDIHTGGIDNMFPHHENEIAQTEAATGKQFVKYWLHCAHLVVEGKKMSKSLGNFYTLRDLHEMGHDPMAIRWVLIATHYRQPNNFSFDALDAAKQSLNRIRDFRIRMSEIMKHKTDGKSEEQTKLTEKCEKCFGEALDDDLNVSAALAAVFDFIRDTNKLADGNKLCAKDAESVVDLLDRLDCAVGLFKDMKEDGPPNHLQDLLLERQEARRSKDFMRADEIRDQIAAEGWTLEDTPDGPRLKKQ